VPSILAPGLIVLLKTWYQLVATDKFTQRFPDPPAFVFLSLVVRAYQQQLFSLLSASNVKKAIQVLL
jgi:predicted membrane metal-binding protein